MTAEVRGGRSVVFHCRAGIGRSSTMAAAALTCFGIGADEAFARISEARGLQVPDTDEQIDWVRRFLSLVSLNFYMKYLRLLPLIAFFIGLLIECVLGTGATMLFQWYGLAALGIAGVLSAILIKEKLKFAPSDICVLLYPIAAGYFVGRATTSPVVYHAREDIVLVLGCLAVYLFSAFALAHPRRRVFLFWALVALALGNLVVGVQHLRGDPAFHILPNYSRTYAEGRIGGFFNNPNHFAAFLIFPSLACLAMALFGRGGPAKKLLIGFVGIAAAIGVALSASRGGIIGLGMGGVVLCIASIILLRVFSPIISKSSSSPPRRFSWSAAARSIT
ncbi:MAG: hypothetical protein R3F11_07800 [Verrucomicrobiales bacterium]